MREGGWEGGSEGRGSVHPFKQFPDCSDTGIYMYVWLYTYSKGSNGHMYIIIPELRGVGGEGHILVFKGVLPCLATRTLLS